MTPKQKVVLQYMARALLLIILLMLGIAVCFGYVENSPVEVVSSMTKEFVPVPVEEAAEERVESIEEVSEPVLTKEVQVAEPDKFEGVLTPSNLTSEELKRGLLHDLKDYADIFIQAEKETGINAVFLSSVAALESGWARSEVSTTKNNLFGWTANSGYRYFDSKEECILFVASKLKEMYLTEDGVCFNGYEVSDINVRYNGSQHWEDTVTEIMSQIQSRIDREE